MTKHITIKSNWAKLYGGRRLLGKLRIFDLNEPAAYISHFNIKEEYRNKGNGQYLIETAIEYAKQRGCTAISLHCSISNISALRFYKRHNFFIAATTTKPRLSFETGLVENNYLMAKQI